MNWRRWLLGDAKFGEAEGYLRFQYAFAMILMWAGLPLLALFIAGDLSGANVIATHGRTVRVYFLLSCVLIWLLRGHKQRFVPVVWVFALSTLLVHCSGFMFVPEDESRLVWFYSLNAGVYILLGRRVGALFTVASMAAVVVGNGHLAAPISQRGMSTFLASLVSLSVIFHAFTQRTEAFFKAMMASNARLRHLSEHDPLTGVFNARAFAQTCESLMRLGARQSAPYAVLFIDLDHFKRVNDQYGHDAGDAVLKTVAACMTRRLRQSDVLGRVGGEEFVAFLPSTDTKGAMTLAEALRQDIQSAQPHLADGTKLEVTASIGVAPATSMLSTLDELQRHADQAMYQAKATGRNRVTLFAVAAATA
jgi:diguanylate cyclase (GGDEF)-like protein